MIHCKVWTGKLQPHIEWELTKANVREVTQVEWTSKGDQEVKFVEYRFYLSRLPLYYTMYIIAPTIIVTGIVILVFHLPNIGGEKSTLSISGRFHPQNRFRQIRRQHRFTQLTPFMVETVQVLLALTFFLTLVSGITPRASFQVPLISKYLLFSMTLVGVSIVSSVFVANIHHRTPQTHKFPPWCRHVFLTVRDPHT